MSTNLAESDESLQAFVADPQWVHFVGALMREQLGAVFEELEHAHYPPGTPKNDLFHLRLMNWEEMQWAMASIPAQDKHLMEAVCAKHGMRVADGVPTMVGPDGVKRFPADNARVFHLEARGMPKKAMDDVGGVDHPADFIRGLPMLKTQQERDVAHKLVDILAPFQPGQRGTILKKAMERVSEGGAEKVWYEEGYAHGTREAQEEFKHIMQLPPAQKRQALLKWRRDNQRRLAELAAKRSTAEQRIVELDVERNLLADIRTWLDRPLVLQSPQGSAWHKVEEANARKRLFTLKMAGDALGTATLDGSAPNVFVVEHDWAAAFIHATDFEGGAVRLPFDLCVFEFQLSGRRVCVLMGQSEAQEVIGAGVIFVAGANDAWCAMGPPQSDGDLGSLITRQVRAICIALDAEVAVSGIERAPAKLNEARAKKDKPPLKDYHVVSLARRARATPLPRSGDEPAWHKRLHFVRGHWRHYEAKAHKTWIKWHLRGNPDLGFIDKHYKL